jgi:hypothetical protein
MCATKGLSFIQILKGVLLGIMSMNIQFNVYIVVVYATSP